MWGFRPVVSPLKSELSFQSGGVPPAEDARSLRPLRGNARNLLCRPCG